MQTQQDLHDSMFIAIDHWREIIAFADRLTIILSNIDEIYFEIQILIFGLLSLNAHYFLNGFPDIKKFKIVSEFITLDLSEVEHVLYNKIHQGSRILLDFFAFIKFFQNLNTLFKGLRLSQFWIKLVETLQHLHVESLFFYILCHYGIQRITELVRDTSVNQ